MPDNELMVLSWLQICPSTYNTLFPLLYLLLPVYYIQCTLHILFPYSRPLIIHIRSSHISIHYTCTSHPIHRTYLYSSNFHTTYYSTPLIVVNMPTPLHHQSHSLLLYTSQSTHSTSRFTFLLTLHHTQYSSHHTYSYSTPTSTFLLTHIIHSAHYSTLYFTSYFLILVPNYSLNYSPSPNFVEL